MEYLCKNIGKTYGRLTVLGIKNGVYRLGNGYRKLYTCKCSCGTIKDIDKYHLLGNKTVSCGCIILEGTRTTHGQSGQTTREYRSWKSMKDRCLNTANKAYKNYGARGITIDSTWIDSFETFYADMGKSNGLTLERKNNSLGYCKDNCVWATKQAQAVNRRTTDFITYAGETRYQKDWAKILNIPYKTLNRRLKHLNWSVEKAFSTPVRSRIANSSSL